MPGGGAATNAGIDFQHRVGAVAMLAMLSEVADLSWLGVGDHDLSELRFETSDGVDDLVILTDGPRVFVQAKRSLNLSAVATSEFSSVLRQFVEEFVREPSAESAYVLATSPSASRRITSDLRKLTEAARLNESGADSNPLTANEQEVRDFTYRLLELHFHEATGRAMSDAERAELFRRIRVAVLDLENGGALERAVLTVLSTRTAAPTSVWASLIALALSLAAERLSIDKSALTERMGHLFKTTDDPEPVFSQEDVVKLTIANQLSAGREVVLAPYDGNLVLAELIRFDADGTRRVRFVDGCVEFPNGISWEVLRRTSTLAGMERMILADPSIVKDRDVVLWPISDDAEDPEQSPWAQAHAASCEEQLRAHAPLLECLRCGRPIAENLAPAVEVDEEGIPHDVGLVHSRCLQPMHRVLGRVSSEGLADSLTPPDFDSRTWFSARPTGQGAFTNMSPVIQAQIVGIAWEPGHTDTEVGNWGVTYELEDGSERFVLKRGRVLRLTESEAHEQARVMNASISKAESDNDPLCIATTGSAHMFGPYSLLLKSECRAQPLRVVSAEARELTRATIVANNVVENFYAPLLALSTSETGAPFTIGEARILLTEPARFVDSVANWKDAGVAAPSLATSIVRSDDQFDVLVTRAFREGMGVVIDPVLDRSGELVSAFVVTDAGSLLHSAKGDIAQ
jgi:hypothetical protein